MRAPPQIDLEAFFTFLRFKSISTDPQYNKETLQCAEWVADRLNTIGFDVETWETSGKPVVFAFYDKAGVDQPTLLIYNHYDVQPVDPIEEWDTAPFEPEVRNGQVYARGAQDNKGQCFYVLEALRHLMENEGKLPINIKLCIEGEEECGSGGLAEILPKKTEKLKADSLAIVDAGIHAMQAPAVTVGVRGIVALDVTLTGSNSDLHSGSHGGLAFNPIHALTAMLASLRGPDGKITVSGFYDAVKTPTDAELAQIDLHFDEKEYAKLFGVPPTGGEQNYSPAERSWLRPTLEINGISGGYAGEGVKTVIPAKANGKITCRLVPDQDPKIIAQAVAAHLKQHTPKGITTEVTIEHGGGAVRANPNAKVVQAFAKAYSTAFNKPCSFILEGGSIPIVTQLAQASQSEVALVGLALPDDNIHAPNEHFGVDRLELGAKIIVETLHNLSCK